MRKLALILALLPTVGATETLVAAYNIRSQSALSPTDVRIIQDTIPGALSTLDALEGQEARINIYAGRPIRPGDLQPAALIERNQIIMLHYSQGGLQIVTEGRALDRAGIGQGVRVMNLSSRTIVSGVVTPTGRVMVGSHPIQ